MINETSGDLLRADVDAIVNTVNCVGVMGKGIALQVKRRYPDVFAAYARECKVGNVRIGQMLAVPTNELLGPAWVINFPTKTHWKAPSRLSYITDGLPDLLRIVKELGIHSIAIPPLGAGNGGLDWAEVRPLIHHAFDGLQDVCVELFTPTNAFQHIRQSTRVKMTRARALVLALMNRYADAHAEVEPHSGKGLSHLEIQKLLYSQTWSTLHCGSVSRLGASHGNHDGPPRPHRRADLALRAHPGRWRHAGARDMGRLAGPAGGTSRPKGRDGPCSRWARCPSRPGATP